MSTSPRCALPLQRLASAGCSRHTVQQPTSCRHDRYPDDAIDSICGGAARHTYRNPLENLHENILRDNKPSKGLVFDVSRLVD